VSVITAISRDHTRELGTRLDAIALEKSGILRPGRVAVIAPQRPTVRRALLRACAMVGATAREVRPAGGDVAAALPLRGPHQRANLAAALAAAAALAQDGVTYRAGAAAKGLRRLRWPGRFEVVAGPPIIILDGAHNDGSADALAATLRREFPRRRVRFVIGLMADKDARALLRPLLPLARSVEATWVAGPRALAPKDLARLCRGVKASAHDDPADAIAAARRDAGERDVVCVTGSLALVGRARDVLGLPFAERLW
jgi:dihydrofolate synthase/folylpolyglutamate synthase